MGCMDKVVVVYMGCMDKVVVLFQILCLVHYLLDRWIHVHEVCAAGRGCGDNPPL